VQYEVEAGERPATLSESIVRRSLESAYARPLVTEPALPTASSLLQGYSHQPRRYELTPAPSSAAGFARLATLHAPQSFAPEATAPPFPEHAAFERSTFTQPTFEQSRLPESTRYVAPPQERAYRLFENQSPAGWQTPAPTPSGASIWDRAQSMEPAYYQASADDVLLAPAVQDYAVAPPGVGRVMLDGLDAVQGGEPAMSPRYQPTPLGEIVPSRSYRPRSSEITAEAAANVPQVAPLPENWQMAERAYAAMDFLWVPSNIFYSPLYFEDPALERSGHSHGPLLQPLASVSRFGVQLVGLPYQMALDPPHRRVYPLGFHRPGESAPKQVPNIPLNAEAAAKAGAVYTGLIFAFP
jgi:hypothetical protein